MRARCVIPLIVIPLLPVAGAAVAQESRATGGGRSSEPADAGVLLPAFAARTDSPPRIDGVLDDPCWSLARPVDDFTQSNPVPGDPPTERTSFRVLYDDRNLYIGVRCFDGDPGAILARQTRRDRGTQGDDGVFISIDSNSDRRTGFFFDVGAAGARTDGLIDNDRGIGSSWDGIWEAETSIDDKGWSAEIRIPLATITFDTGKPWGFNIARTIGRKRETVRWRNWRREGTIRQVSHAGTLEGLEGLAQGAGLTFKPYVSARHDIRNHDVDVVTGADLFYRITPQVTLTLTYNTDFAEAEVDDRVVNLTRFPLFFPERRDFFLEDAGVFDFGGIRRSPRPFFSRRIGISGGRQKGILAGARLTGRRGRVRFGAMTVQMDHDDELGDKNLSVARVQIDALEESSIGFIVTNGDPADAGDNTLVGADFNYRNTSAFGGRGRITGGLFAQATTTDTVGVHNDNSDSSAVGGRFAVNNDPWDFRWFFSRIGENYDPALGFVSRRGRFEYNADAGYTFRYSEDESRLRNIRLSTNMSLFTDLGSVVDTFDYNILFTRFTFHSGDSLSGRFFFSRDNPTEPFEIVDGVTIPAATYDNLGVSLSAGSSSTRPIAVSGSVTARGFYDGDRRDYRVGLALRPGPYFSATASYSINDIDLPRGSFVVRLFSMRASVQFTPDLSWDNTIQWDNQSDELGLNSRVRWEFRPGQELFVVYNEGFDVRDDTFTSVRQALTIKLGLAFQF